MRKALRPFTQFELTNFIRFAIINEEIRQRKTVKPMHVINLTKLNEAMTASATAISEADATFLQGLYKIAKEIQLHAADRPIILLSGPSGSGKTTTAYLLERFLDKWKIETHTVSMDHFFRTMTPQQQQLAANGKLDLESPDRVDVQYLNQQLQKIIAGESTWMPKYHFSTMTREDHSWLLTRKPQELLILEGIHALNPSVIQIPNEKTVRIYASVRTRVTHNHITLPPACLRLVRRMIRDRNFRRRSLSETIDMFERVQQGEKNYIMPFKERAIFSVDTFLPYELGVYKAILNDDLASVWEHPMLDELRSIWDVIQPLPLKQVPTNSLIREFVGSGVFHY
ncbi:MAG: nucleoside kinase [Ruminococcus sp.]|nr:nucleoside kinase [Ruminococcus sp.]